MTSPDVTLADAPASARLRSLVDELAEMRSGSRFVLDLPTDPAWSALPETLADLVARHASLAERVGDRRTAASYLGSWICEVPIVAVGLPAVLAGVVVEVELDDLHVRRHPEGWFDGVALDVLDVRGDPDVLAVVAAHVHRLTAPLVDAVGAALPVGRAALWGGAADALASLALLAAREGRRDQAQVWAGVEAFLDVLQRHVGRFVRPAPAPVVWSGGTSWFATRGTCCLYYRTCTDADPAGDGYCATCPLRTADSGLRRLTDHLEATVVMA